MTHMRNRFLEYLSLSNHSARPLESYIDCIRGLVEYFRKTPE